jgi:hypothetical protein
MRSTITAYMFGCVADSGRTTHSDVSASADAVMMSWLPTFTVATAKALTPVSPRQTDNSVT